MTRALKILVVEDSPDDTEMMILALKKGGFDPEWVRVETADALAGALAAGGWDAIISDYNLPEFGAVAALELVRSTDPDLPFLVVSGTVGEEVAVGTMRAGANDYVLKQNLTRLAPALDRELRESLNRRARRDAEQDLLSQHAILRSQSEASPDGILVVGPTNRVLSYNRRFLSVWGIDEDLVATGDDTAILAMARSLTADPDRFYARVMAIYANLELQSQDEVSLADGRTLERYSGPVRGADGERLGRVWYFRDITARKRTEAERDSLLAQLNLQIERMPLAYLLCDPDFKYTRWNPAAERMFGFAEAEILGRHPSETIVPPQSKEIVDSTFARLAAGDMNANGVCENSTKNGATITCEWHNTPLFGTDGHFQGVLSLAQDITARLSLEEQFRQAQKLEAVGQLAGGIAHDFNNLLTIINGYSELLLDDLPADDPSRELVGEIHKAGERSAGLTRQLLAFSRQQVLAPQVLDLNEVATNTGKMLRRLIGEDIRLATALAPDLGMVRADHGQIEQVLMNLAVNARDAMPRGGRLTIETRNVELDESYVRTHAEAHAGPYVLLSLSDTGCGISPDVAARIFEPFFTTKGIGKGTGLGLATVYGIVKQSGGHVAVFSEVGHGTTFQVYLPRVEDAAGTKKGRSWVQASPRGTETILIVEDEDGVRSLTRHILSGCGYTVLEAGDGDEALRLVADYVGPIQLLISDVVMPGIGGRVVAESVAERHPGVRVLFVSG